MKMKDSWEKNYTQKELVRYFKFDQAHLIDLKNEIINQRDNCLKNQVKFTLGTFCILASDKASSFLDKSQVNENPVKKPVSASTKEKIVLKLEEHTSNQVFDSCLPMIRGLCVSS